MEHMKGLSLSHWNFLDKEQWMLRIGENWLTQVRVK